MRAPQLPAWAIFRGAWRLVGVHWIGLCVALIVLLPVMAAVIGAAIMIVLEAFSAAPWGFYKLQSYVYVDLTIVYIVGTPAVLAVMATVPFHFVWQRLALRAASVPLAASNRVYLCARFIARFIGFGILALVVVAPTLLVPPGYRIGPGAPVLAGGAVALYLIARLSLVLPAEAAGQTLHWGQAWAATRARGLALAVLIASAMLPLVVLDGGIIAAVAACSGGNACHAIAELDSSIIVGAIYVVHMAGYFLSSAILSGVLAGAYSVLVAVRAPALANAVA